MPIIPWQTRKEPWIALIDDPIIAKDFNYFAETSFKRYFSKEEICFKYKQDHRQYYSK
jgi:hypothetical protein